MIIRYLSDLHLEFIKSNKINEFISKIPSGIDEICVLAGDIGNPYQPNYDIFMNFISKNFKKAFVISGNHEYYNKTKTIAETDKFLQDYFQQFNNVSFLNNNYEHYENFCFIGTTLWTNITNPSYKISDVDSIPNFDCVAYNDLNRICVAFLHDSLQNNENCIVITHHMPSNSLIDNKYKKRVLLPYNQWFYCDMDKLIETKKSKIKCWIYGHTHMPSNVVISGIPFLCNPIGYPDENVNINFHTTITL